MSTLIKYQNVDICQKDQIVLKNVNLEIEKGKFYYLIGKVGSGKSSLMKTMYAEIPIEGGEARIFNYDLRAIANYYGGKKSCAGSCYAGRRKPCGTH